MTLLSPPPEPHSTPPAAGRDRPLRRRSPHRMVAATVAALAAAGATAMVVLADLRDAPVEQRTPAQVAALARMEPYAELLSGDFERGVTLLPDTLVRDISVAADGLSASGVIALPVGDGSCAVINVEVGPAYLLDGDLEALSVTGPVLLDATRCP